jgi:hypothetical protein
MTFGLGATSAHFPTAACAATARAASRATPHAARACWQARRSCALPRGVLRQRCCRIMSQAEVASALAEAAKLLREGDPHGALSHVGRVAPAARGVACYEMCV